MKLINIREDDTVATVCRVDKSEEPEEGEEGVESEETGLNPSSDAEAPANGAEEEANSDADDSCR
ncbi:hypothetical protein [Paenibacillus sp. FSL M7-0831]|uniref:hypothetical protein n=1 Tax=Paenibacillus sp. FSL M7-0831 TaxID=2975314 RepID=UPI0030F7394A